MNLSTMTQRKSPQPNKSKQSRPSDSAFDVWLNRGLHKLFDDVASEPIPEELLKLIEEDQKK